MWGKNKSPLPLLDECLFSQVGVITKFSNSMIFKYFLILEYLMLDKISFGVTTSSLNS